MILDPTINQLISDINECVEGTDECDEHCYNTIGSYYCNCTGPDYQLHSDGNTCESEYTKLQISNVIHNTCLQISMNVLRALMIVLRYVQTLTEVMSAPVLLVIY